MTVVRAHEFVELGDHLGRDIGPALDAGRGIEGVQHAVVRADIDRGRLAHLGEAVSLIGVASGRAGRQPVVGIVVGANVTGAGVHDVAQRDVALAQRATAVLVIGIAAAQPVDAPLAQRVRQAGHRIRAEHRLERGRQLTPAELQETAGRRIARVDPARGMRRDRGRRVPLHAADATVGQQVVRDQLARPLPRVVAGLEQLGSGTCARGRGSGARTRADRIGQNAGQRLLQGRGKLAGRARVEHFPAPVHRRVIKIIDLHRIALRGGIGPGRRIGVGVRDPVVGAAEPVALRTQSDAIGVHVRIAVAVQIPGRIGIAAGRGHRHLPGWQVAAHPQVVAHRDVGDGVGIGVLVRRSAAAVGVAHAGARVRIGEPVGELQREIPLAGLLHDGAVAVELLAHEPEGRTIGRSTAVAAYAVERLVQVVALVVDVPHRQARDQAVDRRHADARAIDIGEGAAHARAQREMALAVVLEPVGEIAHFRAAGGDLVAHQAGAVGCDRVHAARKGHGGIGRIVHVGGRVGGGAVVVAAADAESRRRRAARVIGGRVIGERQAHRSAGPARVARGAGAHAVLHPEHPVGRVR